MYTAVQPVTTMELLHKIQWNTCHQMAPLAFRFYKIQFWASAPDLAGGDHDAPPDSVVV